MERLFPTVRKVAGDRAEKVEMLEVTEWAEGLESGEME